VALLLVERRPIPPSLQSISWMIQPMDVICNNVICIKKVRSVLFSANGIQCIYGFTCQHILHCNLALIAQCWSWQGRTSPYAVLLLYYLAITDVAIATGVTTVWQDPGNGNCGSLWFIKHWVFWSTAEGVPPVVPQPSKGAGVIVKDAAAEAIWRVLFALITFSHDPVGDPFAYVQCDFIPQYKVTDRRQSLWRIYWRNLSWKLRITWSCVTAVDAGGYMSKSLS
jgi:hypothetical protein